MAVKSLTRTRVNFIYGNMNFRLRVTTHAANQMDARCAINSTLLQRLKDFGTRLERVPQSAIGYTPQNRDSVIFFFADTGDTYFVTFTTVAKDSNRKVEIEMDMIVETYLRRSLEHFSKIRTSPKDVGITIFADDTMVVGKNNQWFL